MGSFRDNLLTSITNEDVKTLMGQFMDAHDKLFEDMDNLSYEDYKIRNKAMWAIRNEASNIEGDFFLITPWGLEAKAEKLYGDKFREGYLK